MMTSHWIPQAEDALAGKGDEGVTVVPHGVPEVFDGDGVRAATAPFLAAFMWAASYLREQMTADTLDWLSLLLKLFALALTVRTLLALRLLLLRMRLKSRAKSYGLCLTDHGFLLRTPEGDIAVPKEDIVAIKEPGALGERGSSHIPVYVVTQPRSGRSYVALPPVFDRNPRALAERLMRWLGPPQQREGFSPPDPSELPSKLYDAAARGEAGPDVVVIRHGASWLRRAPYATVLLGLTIADSYLRTAPELRARLGAVAPGILVFSLLFVPLLWVILVRIDIAPRKGLSLVLTHAEVMMRTRSGVHVLPWSDLKRASVVIRKTWSLLRGPHETRSLLLERMDGDTINYVESFLGAPAEVIVGLCEAFRRGAIFASRGNSDADEQGA